jgi:SNF2 family DNA or RNA helicase
MLEKLRHPLHLQPVKDILGLNAELREYQKRGVAWLVFLEQLGLSGCLADDMGLGKTLQVIARLVMAQNEACHGPSLLVAPTSVLGN